MNLFDATQEKISKALLTGNIDSLGNMFSQDLKDVLQQFAGVRPNKESCVWNQEKDMGENMAWFIPACTEVGLRSLEIIDDLRKKDLCPFCGKKLALILKEDNNMSIGIDLSNKVDISI